MKQAASKALFVVETKTYLLKEFYLLAYKAV
jgi:hypothetical protein